MKKCLLLLLALVLTASILPAFAADLEASEYAQLHKHSCAELVSLSRNPPPPEEISQREDLKFFELQSSGSGFAVYLHPDGLDASGRYYGISYETSNGGRSWRVLDENFICNQGPGDILCLDDVILIASDQPKGCGGMIEVSYDRGHTWEEPILFEDLLNYDPEQCRLLPTVLNGNSETGLVTIGWHNIDLDRGSEDYILFTQFDLRQLRFTEILYCHPELDITIRS